MYPLAPLQHRLSRGKKLKNHSAQVASLVFGQHYYICNPPG